MLVLSRRPDETLRIGEDIEIVIVEVRGSTVRLGVNAPKDLKVLRGELGPPAPALPPAPVLPVGSVPRFPDKDLLP